MAAAATFDFEFLAFVRNESAKTDAVMRFIERVYSVIHSDTK